MIKRIFAPTIILAIIAASLLYASGAQANSTSLSDFAGITAYTQIELGEGDAVDLEAVKSAFLMVEYETPDLVVGTLDLPLYETAYDPLVLVTAVGEIVAFYPNEDPASKLVDVLSKNLDETLLEKAVKIVADAAGVVPGPISHYDFGNPVATNMLLVAEYEPDGNAFTLQFGTGNTYAEKSYAFYRTFAPSFTLDNDTTEQVNFVETNADYYGAGYYGTIYDHFPVEVPDSDPIEIIDFDPETEYTFAVQAGDHLGFGVLAILYSGDAAYTVNNADFSRSISLNHLDLKLKN